MDTYSFQALGTVWELRVHEASLTAEVKESVVTWLHDFEQRFSRFVDGSEVNQFKSTPAGTYEISNTFLLLLKRAALLRTLTEGAFDPAVGTLLEQAGYDQQYSLEPKKGLSDSILSNWEIERDKLVIEGPVSFDFGGIGKGYAIDQVAALLGELGYEHYVVDAGGDMFGTTKADGSPWRVAIEYPGKPGQAIGVAELKHMGIAVSDVFRRRWQNWHHIVDVTKKKPVATIAGAAAVAPSAFDADCMTSALFLAPQQNYQAAAAELGAQYLRINTGGTLLKSSDWAGEVF